MTQKRAVCLNCIDGRVQLPVVEWIKEHYPVDFVDMITEPGMDGLLADSQYPLKTIIPKVQISVDKNDASLVFIVGHHDCKGNAVDDSMHKDHIRSSVERIKTEFSDIDVIGIWINKEWQGESL